MVRNNRKAVKQCRQAGGKNKKKMYKIPRRTSTSIERNESIEGETIEQQTTDNGFMGDVIIEVKLNKKGTLRARGFSRSNADNLTKKSDTQGIGLSFSQSFNTLADLFRGNKKREKIKKTN